MEGVGAQEARAPVRTRPLTPTLSQRACDISCHYLSLQRHFIWPYTNISVTSRKVAMWVDSVTA
jgi:hypothetical protein